MSDDPRQLRKVLLEEATTEQKQQFARILADQCVEAEKRSKHELPWFFVPSITEYDRMVKYSGDDGCPKCKKGRIVVEIYNGNIGQGLTLKCKWGEPGCDFSEYISDD